MNNLVNYFREYVKKELQTDIIVDEKTFNIYKLNPISGKSFAIIILNDTKLTNQQKIELFQEMKNRGYDFNINKSNNLFFELITIYQKDKNKENFKQFFDLFIKCNVDINYRESNNENIYFKLIRSDIFDLDIYESLIDDYHVRPDIMIDEIGSIFNMYLKIKNVETLNETQLNSFMDLIKLYSRKGFDEYIKQPNYTNFDIGQILATSKKLDVTRYNLLYHDIGLNPDLINKTKMSLINYVAYNKNLFNIVLNDTKYYTKESIQGLMNKISNFNSKEIVEVITSAMKAKLEKEFVAIIENAYPSILPDIVENIIKERNRNINLTEEDKYQMAKNLRKFERIKFDNYIDTREL